MRTIEREADIREGLDALMRADPEIGNILAIAGEVPLRRGEGGFVGLARIVTAQQLSKAAADTIWGRVTGFLDPLTPAGVLAAEDEALRACGLSAAKIRTFRAAAHAVDGGHVDLDALAALPAEEIGEILRTIKGIGPWTAEIYCLFCLGHADIFPAGDLALRVAVGEAYGLGERPGEAEVVELAQRWSPWRGVAARLFWSYYAARHRRADPAGALQGA